VSGAAQGPLDPGCLERLARTVGDAGVDLVLEVIDLVLAETPQRMADMDGCLAAGDLAGAAAVAHSMQGRWGVVGAHHLLGLCQRLEDHASAGDARGASATRVEMGEELGRVLDAVREARRGYAP
jgi:HPt (histidine-containing phosphotransfer) domain-containing protein